MPEETDYCARCQQHKGRTMKNDQISETSLDSLLDRIQTEGIQKAENTASEIIAAAHQKADVIVAEARQEFKTLDDDHKQQIKHREETSNSRLAHAGRDIILNIKAEIISLFERVLLDECRSCLDGKNLATVIQQVIAGWQVEHNDSRNLEILVNEQESHTLCNEILADLQKQANDGIEVKGHPDVSAGFRIAKKGDNLYYDFTDQAVAETLAQYLKPELAALLDGAQGNDSKKTKPAG